MNTNMSYARLDTLRIEQAAITFGVFSNARLESMKVQRTEFVDVTFAGAKLQGSTFSKGTLFANANFEDAKLGLATFSDVTFREYTNLRDAELLGAKFENISFDDKEVFAHINISGAEFCRYKDPGDPALPCPTSIPQSVADRMWYWNDNPPKGLSHRDLETLKIKKCPGTDLANRKPKIGSRTISLAGIHDQLLSLIVFGRDTSRCRKTVLCPSMTNSAPQPLKAHKLVLTVGATIINADHSLRFADKFQHLCHLVLVHADVAPVATKAKSHVMALVGHKVHTRIHPIATRHSQRRSAVPPTLAR